MIDAAYLDKHFYPNFFGLDEETIYKFRDRSNDGSVNNVIVGLHPHCYGIMLQDDEVSLDYEVYYINGNDGLVGDLLRLNIHDPERDRLLTIFSSHIADTYKLDMLEVFNTFQDMTRTLCEQLGYLTVKINDYQHLKGLDSVFIAKDVKGLIFVPFFYHKDIYAYIFGKIDYEKMEPGDDHVYLIFNDRNKFVKIGKSKNPSLREKTLQGEDPELFMIAVWRANAKLERVLHKKYADKRKRGEWFELSFADMKEIKRFAANNLEFS